MIYLSVSGLPLWLSIVLVGIIGTIYTSLVSCFQKPHMSVAPVSVVLYGLDNKCIRGLYVSIEIQNTEYKFYF